jgi:hypothetical protein
MQNNRERILAFLETQDIDLEGDAYVGKFELDNWKSIEAWLKNNLQGRKDMVNLDTGEAITLSGRGIDKLNHRARSEPEDYRKSFVHIPQIIEAMRFLAEEENVKGNGKYYFYRYFATGLCWNGAAHTMWSTIGVRDGASYYDQATFPHGKKDLLASFLKRKGLSNIGVQLGLAGLNADIDLSLPKYRKFLEIMDLAFGEN